MSIDVPVKTREISEISSCYEEDDQRCRKSIELRTWREQRGSAAGIGGSITRTRRL